MDGDYVSRHEHEELRRSMDSENQRLREEDNRQNQRLKSLEETVKQVAAISTSVEKLALTEIIGVVLVYAAKSVFENLSKNNSWPDKPDKDSPAGVC